jgi:import inner membrane translocase subunit TIM23
MARTKESGRSCSLSVWQLAHLPVLCALASLRQELRLPFSAIHHRDQREVGREALVLAAHPPVRLESHTYTYTAMATTKIQTPLSLLRASAPLGRCVHTSILHAARPSPASSSALVLSRHASSAASTSTTPTQSQTPQLTWDEFLKLRRTRRFINLGSSALSGAASIGVAVPAFAEFEIENIGAQMTGLDPMFIIGGSLMGVGAVGWLLGPFLGTTFFNIWKGSVRKEFARVCHDSARSHSEACLLTAL